MVIPIIMEMVSTRIVYVIFAIFSGIAGVIFIFCEETYGKAMPEVIPEMEEKKQEEKV